MRCGLAQEVFIVLVVRWRQNVVQPIEKAFQEALTIFFFVLLLLNYINTLIMLLKDVDHQFLFFVFNDVLRFALTVANQWGRRGKNSKLVALLSACP